MRHPADPVLRSVLEASLGGLGGNGVADTSIAAHSGDVYFFSPEPLDGPRGILGEANLYLYREGTLRFVHAAAQLLALRLRRRPDLAGCRCHRTATHMAFVTTSRLTGYDNAGYTEIYSYLPAKMNGPATPAGPTARRRRELLRQPERAFHDRRRPDLLLDRRRAGPAGHQ